MIYVFKQNDKILGVFNDFLIFRKKTFYYILDFLVEKKIFISKEEAGKSMKDSFYDFYSKKSKFVKKGKYSWEYIQMEKNTILKETETIKNIPDIPEKKYSINSKYTKIYPKKSSISFKDLNKPLSYLKLSPLYNK